MFSTLFVESPAKASANRTSETIANWIFKSVFVYSQSVRNILRAAHVSTQTTWYNTPSRLDGVQTVNRHAMIVSGSEVIPYLCDTLIPRATPSSEPPNCAPIVSTIWSIASAGGHATKIGLVVIDIDINRRSGSQTTSRYWCGTCTVTVERDSKLRVRNNNNNYGSRWMLFLWGKKGGIGELTEAHSFEYDFHEHYGCHHHLCRKKRSNNRHSYTEQHLSYAAKSGWTIVH